MVLVNRIRCFDQCEFCESPQEFIDAVMLTKSTEYKVNKQIIFDKLKSLIHMLFFNKL